MRDSTRRRIQWSSANGSQDTQEDKHQYCCSN